MIHVKNIFTKPSPITWDTFAKMATNVEGTPSSSLLKTFILGFGWNYT